MFDRPPVFLGIDTNYWIYFAKGDHPKALNEIMKKIDTNEYKIITCKFVIKEWENGIAQTREEVKKDIYEQSKNAYKISEFLKGAEKENFTNILNRYKNQEKERLKIADERIEKIDRIIKSNSIIAPITSRVKDLVITHGVEKKAPFRTKNGTADALIFFSAVEYLKEKKDDGWKSSIFVSNNHKDFSKSKQEKETIDPDLQPYLDECKMYYERNIAKALNLAKEIEDDIDKYMDYEY